MQKCRLCGKERMIYKLGCCKSCYDYNVVKVYFLRDFAKFRVDSQKDLIVEFLNNQDVDKHYLAEKYNLSIRQVFHNIQKYCDYYYARRDNPDIILSDNSTSINN